MGGNRPWWDYVWGVPFILTTILALPVYGGDLPDPVGSRRERLAKLVLAATPPT